MFSKYRPVLFALIYLWPYCLSAAEPLGEADIKWDPVTLYYKETVIAGLNMLMREDSRCAVLDPQSVRMDMNGGTPDDPAFAVDCRNGDSKSVVFFSKFAVENAQPPPAKK